MTINQVASGSSECGLYSAALGNVTNSGTCGTHANWILTDTEILIIYGYGDMDDWTPTTMPWHDYLTDINSVIVMPGVTSIGNSAFGHCSSLASVTIGDNVTTIGVSVFYECSVLESITIPDSVTSIGNYAFNSCTSMTSVTFDGTQPTLGTTSFALGTSSSSVTAVIYSSGWANATVFTSTVIGNYTTLTYVTV